MAVQLTRKQYEELYGSKPVFTKPDTTFEPTPIRMTRAEYDRLYPKKQYEAPRGLGIKETALAGIENIKTGIQKTFGAAEAARPEPEDNIFDEGVARGTLETLFRGLRAGTESVVGLGRTVGGVAQVGLSPVLGPLNIAGEKIGQTIGRALPVGVGSAAEGVTKSPIAMQSLEDILDLSNLAVPEFAARGAKALEPVQKAIEIKLQSGELTPPQVKTFFEDRVSQQALKDLQDLKTKNAKLRNNQFFDDESIQRIADAQAKTGILNNATDYDGTIRIKESGIAQKYRELTIDGADGVVKQLLKREGAKVNVEEIASAMRVAADLKYEGADLINALRGIEKELVGLRKRADEFGDVPLDKVQDMKIASTQYVDYTKPAAASFKKLKGSVYRQIIEDKSNTTIKINGKDKTVKDINAELQKYYRDIENLEALDGLKVKGGRLGKYFSQAIGALIGSSAGQIAGPLGSAIGGVIGAEAGGALRGAQLARSFGRGRSGEIAPNTLLQKAKEAGKKDAVVDLRKPDLKVGAPTNVPKTKEIRQVEARIARNVEEQKKAIASKDYTLVATLKEVYKALVEKLKELIEKATTGSVRGFARLDLGQSKSEGSRKSIQASNKGKTSSSTGVNDTTSFQGFPDLSTKLLEKLKGRTTVSRQFIEDLSNSPDLKQAERDLIRRVLGEGDSGAIPSKLVHFTDAKNLKSIEKNGLRPTKASEGTITDGISLATKRTEANEIFGNAKVDVYVRPNAKSISLKDALDEMGYGSETDLGVIKNIERQAPKWARENGYDILDMRDARGAVYKGMDEIRVLNPDAISTKPFAGSDQISVPDFANKVKSAEQKLSQDSDKSLVVVHNLTEQKLKFADRIGGLVNPSMAVIDPRKNAFESFGDITLVADKNLIRGEKTHLADAYTPRFPSVHTSMPWKDFQRLETDLEPFYKKIGDDARKVYHDDTEMLRNIENNPAVALKFLEEKGIKPSKEGQHYYHPQIREAGLEAEYQTFLDGLYNEYNLIEQMFAGYTNMGRRRYKPVSAEEASKIMSKQKDEGFSYGLGSYRSKVAPVKKSPESIKKEQGRLVTKEQFDVIKESYDEELFALRDKLEPFATNRDSNSFTESSRQLDTIGSVLSGEKDSMKYLRSKFPEAPQEIIDDVLKFREKLRDMPTEYFETKFKRPVKLDEFKLALVPEETSAETIKLLESKGLRVEKYAKGKKQEVMDGLLRQPEAFGAGALPFLSEDETSK